MSEPSRRGRRLGHVAALGLALGLALGCRVRRDNPEHCFYADGDATCLERFDDGSLPYCASPQCSDAPFGCVAEPPEVACYSPCGQDGCETAEGSTGDSTETSTSSDPIPDMPPTPECEFDSDCLEQVNEPFCVSGTCQPCSALPDPSLACATLDPSMPVCHDDICVACSADELGACAELQLACDAETNTCMACTAHDQCAGGAACDLLAGECFPSDEVWHVDGDGGADFETLDQAQDYLNQANHVTFIVHELDGDMHYESSLYAISVTDQRAALLAAPGEAPIIEYDSVQAGIRALGNSTLYVRGVDLRGDTGIDVIGPSTVVVENSEFYANDGAVIEVRDDGTLTLTNSMVRSSFTDARVIVTSNGGEVNIVYSTLLGLLEPLVCDDITGRIFARNSIITAYEGATLTSCSSASLDLRDNALSLEIPVEPFNTVVGFVENDWFVDTLYDLHLTNQIPLAVTSAATWSDGHPIADIDGDPRPVGPGDVDWAGADVPSP